jgi:precorrin-2 dehydrogenase/sirohydrochlorin ferrochelatase
MNLYPIHLNLEGRRCLLVGGGKVAERKAEALKEAGASVFIVSPTVTPALAALAERAEIEWHKGRYGARHLDGVFLVIACTDNRGVNMTVTREALEHNLLTLCADAPEAGSFVSPSAVRRGDLLLTISTGGSSPTLAAVVRDQIEADFGPEWAEMTEIIGTMREIVKTNPTETERKTAVRRALDDPEAQALLRDGRRLEAETRIRECLSLSSA